ncbi:MFS general substrate transporter [Coprinellus micaceus]|uniref:MFS general substrate transporter n=1 Tax=Coprinellus micaceus TaxID=71717 RepID=A0A4Y7TEY2_COPMI|nr:MFS general substrate transporter [Coprinellus micaceus]
MDDDTVCEKGGVIELSKVEEALANPSGPNELPEGGLRAWLVVAGVWITQFCSFGYTNAYGVYNGTSATPECGPDYYVRIYLAEKYTSAQISWIGSVQLFLVLSTGIVAGRAFDNGYFYHLMIGGSVLLVFCTYMVSITQAGKLWQLFLLQGVGTGLAIGLMYIPGMGILSQYFRRRRPFATGIAVSGSALGGAIHPMMLNAWFYGSLGFRNGVRASASLNAGLLILAMFLMKPRYTGTKAYRMGTLESFRKFLKDGPYVVTILGTVFVFGGLYYPIYFLQLNSIKNGISKGLAFYTIAILNGASTVGRIVPNLFANYFGVWNTVVPCVTIASILVFVTLGIDSAPGTIAFAILFGFFSGAYASLLPPMITSLSSHDYEIGARMGVCFVFTGIGGLVGTPIAGALLTSQFIWWRPIVFSGMCVGSGAICFAIARFFTARKKGTQML